MKTITQSLRPISGSSSSKINNSGKLYSTKSNVIKPRISYGGDFKNIVTNSTTFVDKSLFIKEAIENPAQVTLITMPRRFGKSAVFDMMKRFLSIESEDDGFNKKLFEQEIKTLPDGSKSQLNISKEKLLVVDQEKLGQHKLVYPSEIQGKYPVISIDFKDCKGDDIEEVKKLTNKKIIEVFEEFGYLGNSDKSYSDLTTVGIKYREFLQEVKQGNFKTGIKNLGAILHAHHEEKVWILIDEYDAAANKAYREFEDIKEAQKVSDLFRGMFEPALKNNPFLEKSLMTGVQYIVQSGMLSGLNNIEKYNIIDSKFSQYYGVNQEEMESLFEHFDISQEKREQIKYWYNGYQERVPNSTEYIAKYNIWSVVRYLNNQDKGFKSYWEQSGDINFLKKLFKKTEIKEKIESLIDDQSLVFSLRNDFSIEDFKTLKDVTDLSSNTIINNYGKNILFSYLFITGYLTIDPNGGYKLPNKEISYEMEKKIVDYYDTLYRFDPAKILILTNILQEVMTYEEEDKGKFIKSQLSEQFAEKFNELIKECNFINKNEADIVAGIFANEDAAHSILNYIIMQINHAFVATEIYTKKIGSEDKGRADTVAKNKQTGLVIEVKHKGSALEALAQAKIYEELIDTCPDQIFIGLNIATNKEVTIAGEINISSQESQNFTWQHSETYLDE